MMSRILSRASAISVAAMFLMVLVGTAGSGAAAQKPGFSTELTEPTNILPASGEAANPILDQDAQDSSTARNEANGTLAAANAASLAELVAQQPALEDLPEEIRCLAGAIYFEARAETLDGQLAVGRVIVARSKSGRFPNSYCGVVFQPSQFSFIRGNAMPVINQQSRNWKTAVAVAEIAHSGAWQSPVEGALFFHARRVAPSWRLHRVAQIDNHIFYR